MKTEKIMVTLAWRDPAAAPTVEAFTGPGTPSDVVAHRDPGVAHDDHPRAWILATRSGWRVTPLDCGWPTPEDALTAAAKAAADTGCDRVSAADGPPGPASPASHDWFSRLASLAREARAPEPDEDVLSAALMDGVCDAECAGCGFVVDNVEPDFVGVCPECGGLAQSPLVAAGLM